jgi:hypothetical protein
MGRVAPRQERGAGSSSEARGADPAVIQKRRVMSINSALGPRSSVAATGSSAVPQIGQLPGSDRLICACIGQV